MTQSNKLIPGLEALGISGAEGSVYATLADRGHCSASVIADLTGLAKPTVYQALRSLGDKGLVELGTGYGRGAQLVAPEVAFPSLIDRKREQLLTEERVAKELVENIHALEREVQPMDEQILQVTRDRRVIGDLLDRLHLEAKEEVLGLVKLPILTQQVRNEASEGALARGVEIRAIYDPPAVDDPQVAPYLPRWVASGEQARISHQPLPMKFRIFDARVCVLPYSPTADGDVTTLLVVRNPALASGLKALFDYLWADATPVVTTGTDQMDEPAPELDEDQLQVLRLVAQGWTLDRIARHLDVSTRTVKRKLRRVAELLGANSRAELILRAMKAGLIPDNHLDDLVTPKGHPPVEGEHLGPANPQSDGVE